MWVTLEILKKVQDGKIGRRRTMIKTRFIPSISEGIAMPKNGSQ
jgi:hypothetical protein